MIFCNHDRKEVKSMDMYEEIEEVVKKHGYCMDRLNEHINPFDAIICIYDNVQMSCSEGIPISVQSMARKTGASIATCWDIYNKQMEKNNESTH